MERRKDSTWRRRESRAKKMGEVGDWGSELDKEAVWVGFCRGPASVSTLILVLAAASLALQ